MPLVELTNKEIRLAHMLSLLYARMMKGDELGIKNAHYFIQNAYSMDEIYAYIRRMNLLDGVAHDGKE